MDVSISLGHVDKDASDASSSSSSNDSISGLDKSILDAQVEAEKDCNIESLPAAALSEDAMLPVVPKLLSTLSHDKLVQKTLDMKVRNQQLDLLLLKAESYSHFIAENQKRTLSVSLLQQQLKLSNSSSSSNGDSSGKRKAGTPDKSNGTKASKKGQIDTPSSSLKSQNSSSENQQPNSGQKAGGTQLSTFTTVSAFQPKSLTGGVLLPHQVEGLKWLLSLWENGLSGILADEMGLGKTIQIISLIAHLRDNKTNGPFIIVCPLATVCNWINEFKKWCPTCPVVLYHGSKEHREELRKNKMPIRDQKEMSFPVIITSFEIAIIDRPFLEKYSYQYLIVDEGQRIKNRNCRLLKELKRLTPPTTTRLLLTGTPIQNKLEELWSLLNFCSPMIFDDLDVFQSYFGFHNIGLGPTSGGMSAIGKSSKVVGTSVDSIISNEASSGVVTKLHEILRPFLLRRMKSDIKDISLPPKKEVIVYCNLTDLQATYYKAVEDDLIRDLCARMGVPGSKKVSQVNRLMNLRKACNHPFLFGEPTVKEDEKVDSKKGKHVEKMDRSNLDDEASEEKDEKFLAGGRRHIPRSSKSKNVKYVELDENEITDENAHLFENDFDEADNGTDNDAIGDITSIDQMAEGRVFVSDMSPDMIVKFSGKMNVLERMLAHLKENGHKVLIFSQMTSMLDILEHFCHNKSYKYVRFDGSTSMEDRQDSINSFNRKKKDSSKSSSSNVGNSNSMDASDQDEHPFIFLLSTRAGGLGINLTAADTCILFDSDFNPHMDSQAMDRCHRLGQTKPVMVYRFVSTAPAELELMSRQNSKKKLERLTVLGGDYRSAGKRLGSSLTIGSLKKLLQNDISSLDKRFNMALVNNSSNNNSNSNSSSGDSNSSKSIIAMSRAKDEDDTQSGKYCQISDEELQLILNRKLIFPTFYETASTPTKTSSSPSPGRTKLSRKSSSENSTAASGLSKPPTCIPTEGELYEIANSTSDLLNGFSAWNNDSSK